MLVKEEEGWFVPRAVELGPGVGDAYTVRNGLAPGELVVTERSVFLRAEMLRNSPAEGWHMAFGYPVPIVSAGGIRHERRKRRRISWDREYKRHASGSRGHSF